MATVDGIREVAPSPNLQEELIKSINGAMTAHQSMSKEALNSEAIQARLLAVLLGPGALWEGLRGMGQVAA